jgi:hypothetical protein
MAQDIFSSLRNYLSKLSGGEKSPAEVATALKNWLEESGEVIKERIESEIESAASRMGFVRQDDLELLLQRLADLESRTTPSASKSEAKVKSAPQSKTAPSKKSAAPKKKSQAPGSKDSAPKKKSDAPVRKSGAPSKKAK